RCRHPHLAVPKPERGRQGDSRRPGNQVETGQVKRAVPWRRQDSGLPVPGWLEETIMRRKFLWLTLAALLAALLSTSPAQAWGGFHAGFTPFGPGGFYHVGRTAGYGPYGGFSTAHVGGYGAYGGYHAGYGYGERYGGVSYGGYHTYSPYGGYAYGGYHYGDV